MSGFNCQFTEEPPQLIQCRCPICLLILREPFQAICCGKSYCRLCMQRIVAKNKPCPICNEARFDSFRNKGLQQPLYGFRVFCSNKESGCDWQGELGQLDQHLNLNPDKDKLSVGCAYAEVQCLYCNELYPRHEIEHHQTSECAERPFTCSLCEDYESTYADVVTNHSPVCKCRPVECPNSCGTNNLQHQHLEEHVSTQCPLSYVKCEFSDEGCHAKVYRKDLPSHLGENMVAHMSLLATENRKLKLQLKERSLLLKEQSLQLKEQGNENSKLKLQLKDQGNENRKLLQRQADDMKSVVSSVPPIDLCSDLRFVKNGEPWLSKPFYSHVGGYKLQLEIMRLPAKVVVPQLFTKQLLRYQYRYNILPSEFVVPPSRGLCITMNISSGSNVIHTDMLELFFKRDSQFHVFDVEFIFKSISCVTFNVINCKRILFIGMWTDSTSNFV